MYRNFYGLEKKPFELSPKGDVVYLSETHEEGLAMLRYGILADMGFVLLTGGVGMGKTTILNALIQMVSDETHVCLINNPKLTKDEFYCYLGQKLDIVHDGNKARFLFRFAVYLDKLAKNGEKLLIIIDEAQAFSVEMLEEIRLLSNEACESSSLGVFLVGQPELREILKDPKLLPLRQRIGVRYHLNPFTAEDTAQYIVFRLQNAGAANTGIFAKDAVKIIHKASLGNPRLINIVCDSALVDGFTRDQKKISKKIVNRSVKAILLEDEQSLSVSESSSMENTIWKHLRNLFGRN